MNRKRFVVVAGKSDLRLERAAHGRLEKDRANPFLVPTRSMLLKLRGVEAKPKGLVIDIVSKGMPAALQEINSIASITVHPRSAMRLSAERIGIMRQLRRLGHEVLSPKYDGFMSDRMLARVRKEARTFKATAPLAMPVEEMIKLKELNKKIPIEYNQSSLWARDLWAKAGGKRIKRFAVGGENAFGEGGKSLALPNKTIIANRYLMADARKTVGELQAMGYKFFFVGEGEVYSRSLSEFLKTKTYVKHEHVDLMVGTVGKVLLVDREFFRQNRGPIKDAAMHAGGLKIIFVPEKEADMHPANFLQLEKNTVLVDRDAVETIRLLRENGVNVTPTDVPLRANRMHGGGVRCMVNEM